VVVATNNTDKLVEIQQILIDVDVELIPLSKTVAAGIEVEETGDTLEENACLKAREIAMKTGLPAIADDTGLEVDSLDGAPGVHSARYAGEEATYADNCAKLLQALESLPREPRTARFRTVVALSLPDGTTRTVDGVCAGSITHERQGDGGFGYDSVFQPDGGSNTFADMSPADKNRISHRGRAFVAAKLLLAELEL
jgi:XTP/dITP diphosphohydrolase